MKTRLLATALYSIRGIPLPTAPSDPTRSGFSFIGWDTEFATVTSDLTVTALYEAEYSPTATPTPSPGGVPRTGETGSANEAPWLLLAGGVASAVIALVLRKRNVLEG
ncbi:MAG: InlB B-repeat-containing protein [Clostridiales bacterium]|nr:InlB B-repeat-containing protein [Clostridiales bacterium]